MDGSSVFNHDTLDPEFAAFFDPLRPWVFATDDANECFATEDEACARQRQFREAHGFHPVSGERLPSSFVLMKALRAILPYAESRAEDMDGCAEANEEVANEYPEFEEAVRTAARSRADAAKAIAAVEPHAPVQKPRWRYSPISGAWEIVPPADAMPLAA